MDLRVWRLTVDVGHCAKFREFTHVLGVSFERLAYNYMICNVLCGTLCFDEDSLELYWTLSLLPCMVNLRCVLTLLQYSVLRCADIVRECCGDVEVVVMWKLWWCGGWFMGIMYVNSVTVFCIAMRSYCQSMHCGRVRGDWSVVIFYNDNWYIMMIMMIACRWYILCDAVKQCMVQLFNISVR